MRLISQDGMIDVPYESTNVSISYKEKNKIIAWGFGCEEHHIIDLGTYSSHEKAYKVMEMVRKAYLGTTVVSSGGLSFRTLPRAVVFQFPSDDEVEV